MSSRTRSRKQASIGSNHSLRRPTPISASEPRTGNFVLLLVMAWSPPAHNAGNVRVSAPGDYATFNSNHTPDGTAKDVGKESWRRGLGDRNLITACRPVGAGLVIECSDSYAARPVNEAILSSDGLGLGLIRTRAVQRRRDHRSICCILQRTVGSVPHADVDGEADHADQHGQAKCGEDCD